MQSVRQGDNHPGRRAVMLASRRTACVRGRDGSTPLQLLCHTSNVCARETVTRARTSGGREVSVKRDGRPMMPLDWGSSIDQPRVET